MDYLMGAALQRRSSLPLMLTGHSLPSHTLFLLGLQLHGLAAAGRLHVGGWLHQRRSLWMVGDHLHEWAASRAGCALILSCCYQ